MHQKPPKDIAGVIFDVDGCVARGICCAFLTNENMRTRSQVVAKLVAMGIPCTAADVITAAIVAAAVTRALHPGHKVLAVGAAGLVEALQQCGVAVVDAPHAAEATVVVMGKAPHFDMTLLDVVCQTL